MVFGLRSRTRSTTDRTAAAAAAGGTKGAEASDKIGDSPDFGIRRGPSQNSDTSSLRSRTSLSMKRFFSSPRRKAETSTDSEPTAATVTATSKTAGTSTKVNNGVAAHPSPKAVSPPATAVAPALAAPNGSDVLPVNVVSDSVAGGVTGETASSGPRPSELFAGKGVQWNQIDLTTGRDTSTSPDASHPVDLQKFLKERRQWIPTFKDDTQADTSVPTTESTELPKVLDQLNFDDTTATQPVISSSSSAGAGGLKSLRDLEDTHKRKAALLPDATQFQEPGPVTSLSPSASVASTTKLGTAAAELPPAPPAPARNQSFRISTFSADSATAPLASRTSGSLSRKPVPVSTTETHNGTKTDQGSVHRPSSNDTSPLEAAQLPSADQEQNGSAVQDSSQNILDGPVSTPSPSETPPRPPKNGQRVPSRQNSQDVIKSTSTITPSPTTSNLAPISDSLLTKNANDSTNANSTPQS